MESNFLPLLGFLFPFSHDNTSDLMNSTRPPFRLRWTGKPLFTQSVKVTNDILRNWATSALVIRGELSTTFSFLESAIRFENSSLTISRIHARMRREYRYMGWAIVLLTVWVAGIDWFSRGSVSDYGPGFAVYVWVQLTRWVCLWGAGILFVLRVLRVLQPDRNFLYCAAAAMNAVMGLAGVVVYSVGGWSVEALHAFLLNLLVGVILLADIFFFTRLFGKPGDQSDERAQT
jgi:hypothetical protein